MPDFNGGTIVLGKGQWWIAYTLEDGGTATLVEGTLAQVKTWSQNKYGKSVQFPGTSININPSSPAGIGGTSTALIIGPFASKQQAISGAATGNYPSGVSASGNEAGLGTVFGLSGVSGKNILIRGAKIVIGSVLIFLAVARITGAGGFAAKAVKHTPLL